MKNFKIIVWGEEYVVTVKNSRTGLYRLSSSRDGSVHFIGKSNKSNSWIYISKSPFCPVICFAEAVKVIEEVSVNPEVLHPVLGL